MTKIPWGNGLGRYVYMKNLSIKIKERWINRPYMDRIIFPLQVVKGLVDQKQSKQIRVASFTTPKGTSFHADGFWDEFQVFQ